MSQKANDALRDVYNFTYSNLIDCRGTASAGVVNVRVDCSSDLACLESIGFGSDKARRVKFGVLGA